MRTDKHSTRTPVDRGRWLALLVLCAAWSMDVLDFSIVNASDRGRHAPRSHWRTTLPGEADPGLSRRGVRDERRRERRD